MFRNLSGRLRTNYSVSHPAGRYSFERSFPKRPQVARCWLQWESAMEEEVGGWAGRGLKVYQGSESLQLPAVGLQLGVAVLLIRQHPSPQEQGRAQH